MGLQVMKKYIVGIKVMLKDVVLDTQGRALNQVLNQNHMAADSARVGKFFELTLTSDSTASATLHAEKIAVSILINDLIEKYEVLEVKEM